MSKAGLEPDSSCTRPLYLYLSSLEERPSKAWKVLQDLYEDGHTIPIAAINVVIEATIAVGHFDEAVSLYKHTHTLCESGANTETFNIVLQGCSHQRSKDRAMFLASEMAALGIKPDRLTYDRLIMVCLKEDDYEDAFLYLEEMEAVSNRKGEEDGWRMRGGTASAFIKKCVAKNDDRVWLLLEDIERRPDINSGRLRAWVEENWKGDQDPKRLSSPGEGKLKGWAAAL